MERLGFTFDSIEGADLGANGASVAGVCDKHGRTGEHVITYGVLGTVGSAHSAFDALVRADEGQVVVDLNSFHRTDFFTDTASRAAYLANLPDVPSGICGMAPDPDLVADRFQREDIPGAGDNTLVAGCALVGINDGKSVRLHNNSIKGAYCLAGPVPHAGIAAGLASAADEKGGAAIVDAVVLGFHGGLFMGSTTLQNSDLLDHIANLKTEEFRQL